MNVLSQPKSLGPSEMGLCASSANQIAAMIGLLFVWSQIGNFEVSEMRALHLAAF